MSAEIDVSDTTRASSNQLNSDDLISGQITVTIKNVAKADTAEQPISLTISGGHQPFKPCKTVRRILVAAWGKNAAEWIGKSMTLYRDPDVKWAGEKVGGIRISALSGITKPLELSLAESRKSKKRMVIQPLQMVGTQLKDALAAMKQRWKLASEKAGADVTPDGFGKWVSSATGGVIAANAALKSESYNQELLDKCESASLLICKSSDRSSNYGSAYEGLLRQVELCGDEKTRSNLSAQINEMKSDGGLTEDGASDLLDRLR